MTHDEDRTEDYVDFRVRLPLTTVAWLMELCDACHASPLLVLESLINDLKKDDDAAHGFPLGQPADLRLN